MFEKLVALLKLCMPKLGKKALYVVVGWALATIKAKVPDAPLPSVDLVVDGVAALLVTHTTTDIVHIIATFIGEWLREAKANA